MLLATGLALLWATTLLEKPDVEKTEMTGESRDSPIDRLTLEVKTLALAQSQLNFEVSRNRQDSSDDEKIRDLIISINSTVQSIVKWVSMVYGEGMNSGNMPTEFESRIAGARSAIQRALPELQDPATNAWATDLANNLNTATLFAKSQGSDETNE